MKHVVHPCVPLIHRWDADLALFEMWQLLPWLWTLITNSRSFSPSLVSPFTPPPHTHICAFSVPLFGLPTLCKLHLPAPNQTSHSAPFRVSGASSFLSPPSDVPWGQRCSGHTCISSLGCVPYLGNVYLNIRYQARTFLKLNPGIKQLWNLVHFKWERQVFDKHQHMLFALAVQQLFSISSS